MGKPKALWQRTLRDRGTKKSKIYAEHLFPTYVLIFFFFFSIVNYEENLSTKIN